MKRGLRSCRICGKEEMSHLSDCPDCGNKLPPAPPLKKPVYNRTPIIWGTLLLTCVIIFVLAGKGKSNAVKIEPPKTAQTSSSAQSQAAPTPAVPSPPSVATNPKPEQPDLAKLSALISAAEKGDANAQFDLAGRYARGSGVSQDTGEALRWHRLSADQGNVAAQLALARIFENGDGVARNSNEAAKWYRMASAAGSSEAQIEVQKFPR